METSQIGIDLIKSFEGFSKKAVRLSGEQYYTIGYGHYGADVSANMTITKEGAEQLLRSDIRKFEKWVNNYCAAYAKFRPDQPQFDALVSFTYNCGPASLKQLVFGRTAAEVPDHMLAYVNSGSVIYKAGLLRRRKKERALFLTGNLGEDEEAIMEASELWKKIQGYLATQPMPEWAKTEAKNAQMAGIWDGSEPMSLIPRYQAALMSFRARNKAIQEYEPIIKALQEKVENLEKRLGVS